MGVIMMQLVLTVTRLVETGEGDPLKKGGDKKMGPRPEP